MNTNPTRPAGAPAYFLGRSYATWHESIARRRPPRRARPVATAERQRIEGATGRILP